jgi:hypothetical protein
VRLGPPEAEESALSPRLLTTKDTKTTKGGTADLPLSFSFVNFVLFVVSFSDTDQADG